jgi:CRISPR/Cas system CMR-associated protein Cmr5 small subunit
MSQTSGVRRIDQTMAAAAAALLPATVSDDLRTRYRTLRVMVHSAGLAATYAYVASKANGDGDLATAYRDVARGIREHLARRGLLASHVRGDRATLAALAEMDLERYARAAAEVAALTGWMSRLADAVHQRAKDGGEGTDGSR